MARVLIQNGTCVTATDVVQADVLIEGEHIVALGRIDSTQYTDIEHVDATGCYVFPGGIDPHTHLDMPFMGTASSDDFHTGTLAALHGGTTTLIDFAIQTQGESFEETVNAWHAKAKHKAVADYAFHLAVTDLNDYTESELPAIVAQGITSFKVFMAYKGVLMVDDAQLLRLMPRVASLGGMVTAHCENGDMIERFTADLLAQGRTGPDAHPLAHPPLAEAEATGRFLDLASIDRTPAYVVHLSCQAALERLKMAMLRQDPALASYIEAETCIQYLVLNDSLYAERPDAAKWVASPPLRKPEDQAALWEALSQGIIQTVATDHCPFCLDQKAMGDGDFSKIPNGMPGVEHRMELLYSEGVLKKRLTLPQFVRATSTAAAEIFGMAPRKGTLQPGADADIVIFDPNVPHVLSAQLHHHRCDYSAYEGMRMKGKTRTVFLRGRKVIDRGEAFVEPGQGQFIARAGYRQPLRAENTLVNA